MKKLYSEPSIAFVRLDSRNLIATSGTVPDVEDEVIDPTLPNL